MCWEDEQRAGCQRIGMCIILDTSSHLAGQLIKYLIKFLQEGEKENTNKLKFASAPLNGI